MYNVELNCESLLTGHVHHYSLLLFLSTRLCSPQFPNLLNTPHLFTVSIHLKRTWLLAILKLALSISLRRFAYLVAISRVAWWLFFSSFMFGAFTIDLWIVKIHILPRMHFCTTARGAFFATFSGDFQEEVIACRKNSRCFLTPENKVFQVPSVAIII